MSLIVLSPAAQDTQKNNEDDYKEFYIYIFWRYCCLSMTVLDGGQSKSRVLTNVKNNSRVLLLHPSDTVKYVRNFKISKHNNHRFVLCLTFERHQVHSKPIKS